eukprot:evm.model.scf_1142EXC.3 EVM.evm.TU.scf_1142EXC.3   scf_1142EXC:17806-21069(-)
MGGWSGRSLADGTWGDSSKAARRAADFPPPADPPRSIEGSVLGDSRDAPQPTEAQHCGHGSATGTAVRPLDSFQRPVGASQSDWDCWAASRGFGGRSHQSGLSASLLDGPYAESIGGVRTAQVHHGPGNAATTHSDGSMLGCVLRSGSQQRERQWGGGGSGVPKEEEEEAEKGSSRHSGSGSCADSDATGLEVRHEGRKPRAGGGSNGLSDEVLKTMDPKRVKRILSNRVSAARSKRRKAERIVSLERQLEELEREKNLALGNVCRLQEAVDGLSEENCELRREVIFLSSSATASMLAHTPSSAAPETSRISLPDMGDFGMRNAPPLANTSSRSTAEGHDGRQGQGSASAIPNIFADLGKDFDMDSLLDQIGTEEAIGAPGHLDVAEGIPLGTEEPQFMLPHWGTSRVELFMGCPLNGAEWDLPQALGALPSVM